MSYTNPSESEPLTQLSSSSGTWPTDDLVKFPPPRFREPHSTGGGLFARIHYLLQGQEIHMA